MSKTLRRQVFELRFFPLASFFDSKSSLLDELYRDPKTKKKNFEHWQVLDHRITVFDADKSRAFFFSFQNCAFTCLNPPTENYVRDQVLRYVGISLEHFEDKMENIIRAGFRETRIVPIKDFDELSQALTKNFIRTDSPFFQTLGSPVYDLTLFPIIFKHGSNKFQITLGPTKKEELKMLWGEEGDFPDQALFLDVDYYAVQPQVTSDYKTFVGEFLVKARETLAKISESAEKVIGSSA